MSLEARNLTVTVGGKAILDDVSFTAAPGRVTAILGPNGAGKSTLLSAVLGDIAPRGEVRYSGQTGHDPLTLARSRGVMLQEMRLEFPFSVWEVVLLGRCPHRKQQYSADDKRAAWDALERVGCGHLAQQSYMTLSGGERRRVQFARILAQVAAEPEIAPGFLLLDEPTANLDLQFQHLLLEQARRVAQRGFVVVAVLHDINLAASYADDAALLRQGRLEASGPVREVITPPVLEPVFGVPLVQVTHPQTGAPWLLPGDHAPALS